MKTFFLITLISPLLFCSFENGSGSVDLFRFTAENNLVTIQTRIIFQWTYTGVTTTIKKDPFTKQEISSTSVIKTNFTRGPVFDQENLEMSYPIYEPRVIIQEINGVLSDDDGKLKSADKCLETFELVEIKKNEDDKRTDIFVRPILTDEFNHGKSNLLI